MDPVILAGMIFSLVVLAMVGSFILLLPVARLLAQYLQQRLDMGLESGPAPQLGVLQEQLDRIESGLDGLRERQDFVERLLEPGETREEGAAAEPPGAADSTLESPYG